MERRDAAIVDDCCGDNRLHPFEALASGCGRDSPLRCPLRDKGPPLGVFGNVEGTQRGNLTEGSWD